MGGKAYSIKPKVVREIDTPYRRITTKIPVPASIHILEELHRHEPHATTGQPPIVWDRAKGFQVWDAYGNKWLDWSSGVLVANVGHGHPKIVDAIIQQARRHLLHNYCFPSELRAQITKKLVALAPPGLDVAAAPPGRQDRLGPCGRGRPDLAPALPGSGHLPRPRPDAAAPPRGPHRCRFRP